MYTGGLNASDVNRQLGMLLSGLPLTTDQNISSGENSQSQQGGYFDFGSLNPTDFMSGAPPGHTTFGDNSLGAPSFGGGGSSGGGGATGTTPGSTPGSTPGTTPGSAPDQTTGPVDVYGSGSPFGSPSSHGFVGSPDFGSALSGNLADPGAVAGGPVAGSSHGKDTADTSVDFGGITSTGASHASTGSPSGMVGQGFSAMNSGFDPGSTAAATAAAASGGSGMFGGSAFGGFAGVPGGFTSTSSDFNGPIGSFSGFSGFEGVGGYGGFSPSGGFDPGAQAGGFNSGDFSAGFEAGAAAAAGLGEVGGFGGFGNEGVGGFGEGGSDPGGGGFGGW